MLYIYHLQLTCSYTVVRRTLIWTFHTWDSGLEEKHLRLGKRWLGPIPGHYHRPRQCLVGRCWSLSPAISDPPPMEADGGWFSQVCSLLLEFIWSKYLTQCVGFFIWMDGWTITNGTALRRPLWALDCWESSPWPRAPTQGFSGTSAPGSCWVVLTWRFGMTQAGDDNQAEVGPSHYFICLSLDSSPKSEASYLKCI